MFSNKECYNNCLPSISFPGTQFYTLSLETAYGINESPWRYVNTLVVLFLLHRLLPTTEQSEASDDLCYIRERMSPSANLSETCLCFSRTLENTVGVILI
jgi:hypothetical protein